MSSGGVSIIRIPPNRYIHVLDTNTNVTRVVEGPKTYTKQDHERVVTGPEPMVVCPPGYYVVINDPVRRDADGVPEQDEHRQYRLRFGDQEIRMNDNYPDPFPLYPGEVADGPVRKLRVVHRNTSLRLRATRDFYEGDVERQAGDEWLFTGPGTYIPRVEVEEVELIKATIIKTNQALKLKARRKCTDKYGQERQAGVSWLVREPGAYLPGVEEIIVETVKAYILTDKKALHLTAIETFTDVYDNERKAGEEWLVTNELANSHIPDVFERVMGQVSLTTLSNRQFCVVQDPYVKGVQRLGTRQLRKGEASFFLQPGESLEDGIQDVNVLADDEAMLVQAREPFLDRSYSSPDTETADVQRECGDRWMVYGPCEYIPIVQVDIIERRKAIPLDENEGIYVRNLTTGAVKAHIGSTYMLKPMEELWKKELPDEVEQLLERQSHGQTYIVPAHYGGKDWSGEEATGGRDKSRVVTFRVSNNAAVQVYDYKAKTSRVVLGPELVMLGPDEDFTVVRLSGDKPKRPNVISSLCLMLGPDFMTDVITVETSDHARLNLTLSYNWHFDVSATASKPEDGSKAEEEDADNVDYARVFNVRDFVGDACKAIASRVRGAVAAESFDNFHKFSAKIIRGSVFGLDADNRVKDRLVFAANGLVITNVDVQSVEPDDERTRESLQKSVQLAIEITTNSQEARAHHAAKKEEEEAKGALERQRLQNEAEAEASRKRLLQLKAESAAVQTQGQAKAEAAALADAARIKAEADVAQADLAAKAMRIESEARLEQRRKEQQAEIDYQRQLNELEISKATALAEIETKKFGDTVAAIGASTIAEMARAGPEMQAKLLGSLGLSGYLITDGSNPVNLFQTAKGLVAGGAASAAAAASGGDAMSEI